jgi:uncharacterized membrane protein HdeD (DUF308 family)
MTSLADKDPPLERAIESNRRHAGWALILRGVIAVIFGIIALRNANAAVSAIVVVFAVFAFADGALDFFVAVDMGRAGQRWGWYVFEGIVSTAAGVLALTFPGLTMLVLVLFVAVRAIVMGILELGAAFSWPELESRWLLGLTGALSILLGVLLFASPTAGGLALLWTIGVYAIVFGAMIFVLGIRIAEGGRHGLGPTAPVR